MEVEEQKRYRQAMVDSVRGAVIDLNTKLDIANTNGVRLTLAVHDTVTTQRVAVVSAEHVQVFDVR